MWEVEKAAYELHSMCLEAVDEVVECDDLLDRFGIPVELWPAVRKSWRERHDDLAGRFDLLWDGNSPPKLAEYNADTPTVLIESAVVQAQWAHDVRPGEAQFNCLGEAIERAFAATQRPGERFVFTAHAVTPEMGFIEENATSKFVCAIAAKVGIPTQFLDLEDPALEALEGNIRLCKLYPYEWLIRETGGALLQDASLQGDMRWLEPAWKLVASSKAILPFLWEKYPNHPNLLPAYYTSEELLGAQGEDAVSHGGSSHWVGKPRFGREGIGITYSNCDVSDFPDLKTFAAAATAPAVALEGVLPVTAAGSAEHSWHLSHTPVGPPVFQRYHAPARLHGRTVITSAWVVRGLPAAVCFREDNDFTTNNNSSFVPHVVGGGGPAPQQPTYPLSERQHKLRASLYGSDPDSPRQSPPVASALVSTDSDSERIGNRPSHSRSYWTTPYDGGRLGHAAVGGGGVRPSPPASGLNNASRADTNVKKTAETAAHSSGGKAGHDAQAVKVGSPKAPTGTIGRNFGGSAS
jgi:glutathionylspermidine synthase